MSTLGPVLSSSTSTSGASSGATANTTTTVHYHYYAPLPLRVVNEDYALIAGFLGGLLLFALYFAVLICLRCLQQAQKAQPRVWQGSSSPAQAMSSSPAALHMTHAPSAHPHTPQSSDVQFFDPRAPAANPNVHQQHHHSHNTNSSNTNYASNSGVGVSVRRPYTAAAAAAAEAEVAFSAAPQYYARGMPPQTLRIAGSTPSAPPIPPPR